MASDQRWQGGVANRTWQAGTRPVPQVDTDHLIAEVRRYLADCAKYQLPPSQRMCLKAVFHQGAAQEQAVVDAYQQLTGQQAA